MTMTRLCRSQWAEVLIAALALGGGATLRAQQAAPSSQVALIFDDQKVHDGERATLFDLIVELVPVEKWQSVKVTQATDLETIVYHYYYYFSSGEYQAPLTVNALVRAIRRANTLKEGPVPANTEIRIPPIPMRAFGRFDYPRQLRVFTPEAQGYAVSQNATAVAVPTRARLPAAQSQAAVPLRRASSTAIIVDVSAKDIERIGPEALPTNVVALSATATGGTATTAPKVTLGLVPVEFLSAARDECPNPFDALDTSPFRQAQVTRVARVVGADEPQLLEAATRRPLVIMDIGFGSHHGQKVKSVADQVLEKLGAPESLRRKMVPVEMYPVDAAAKANLTSALDEYVASTPELAEKIDEFAQKIQDAKAWITESAQSVAITGPRLDVPEVLIRALLYRYITHGAVVNMSFRMRAPATAALLNEFARDRVSFSVSGVGNVVNVIETGWTPQDAILARSNFVNVTYGTEKGEVLAEYSGDDQAPSHARVPLLAPGCGFAGISDSGSSLASPYVAASSWLRSLLDEVELNRPPSVQDFWQELLLASRPLPMLNHPVESGGMFDAAMLIAKPPHPSLLRNGTITPLATLHATAVCKIPGGTTSIHIDGLPDELKDATVTFAAYVKDGHVFLWARRIPVGNATLATSKTLCELESLSFRAVDVNGGLIEYDAGTLMQFATEVAFVTW